MRIGDKYLHIHLQVIKLLIKSMKRFLQSVKLIHTLKDAAFCVANIQAHRARLICIRILEVERRVAVK